MTINGSGLYGLTLEKMFIDTAAQSLEAETHKMLLTTDSYSPNYDTDDFRNDISTENTGTGYTTGGATITTTEIAIATPAAGQLRWDHDDVSWSSSTITAAMAGVDYFNVGTSATDMLIALLDFVTAVTTVSGLLTVQIATNGVFYLDYTP